VRRAVQLELNGSADHGDVELALPMHMGAMAAMTVVIVIVMVFVFVVVVVVGLCVRVALAVRMAMAPVGVRQRGQAKKQGSQEGGAQKGWRGHVSSGSVWGQEVLCYNLYEPPRGGVSGAQA
jgi:hypothetical protein